MRISPLSVFAPNFVTNSKAKNITVPEIITFNGNRSIEPNEVYKPPFLIRLGEKRTPEVQKRAEEIEEDAQIILTVEAENLKIEAGQNYKKALSELYHLQEAEHVYPASLTLLSYPVALDIKAREEGVYVKLFRQDKKDKKEEEEFFFTHEGVLLEYEKRTGKLRDDESDIAVQRFNFNEDGELTSYREAIETKRHKQIIKKKIDFEDGNIKTIESKSVFNTRTGKRDVNEIFEFKNGKLKYVYENAAIQKDGTKFYKAKYRANANGELKCVYYRLF